MLAVLGGPHIDEGQLMGNQLQAERVIATPTM
jgi:hypothetical protein